MVALALIAGCGAASGGGAASVHGERSGAASKEVTDDAFAGAVHDLLLSEPGSKERAVRLSGVVSRQMLRADAQFKNRQADRGIAAVTGGLYLVRRGELTTEMLGTGGASALREAARELASRGDEGRARAIYELLARVSSPADAKEIQSHLDAIQAWTRDAVGKGGPVASAGGLQRVAMKRALLEPSEAARDEAAKLTVDWIKKSIVLRQNYRSTRTAPPREEAQEAFRALQVGGTTLAAIYVRDGDAAGALKAIDQAQARDLVSDGLFGALEALAVKVDAARYLDVLKELRPAPGRDAQREDEDTGDERELFRGVAFRVAMEAYRLDPSNPEIAGVLAAGLQELGMGEASPAVLLEAVKAHPDARIAGGALAITMQAMMFEVDAGDPAAARRAFKASTPLLEAADAKGVAGKAQPSAAKVHALMGDIELREGRIDEARVQFKAAAASEPSGIVLLSLARIEWHAKEVDPAVAHLKEGLASPDTAKNPALKGEILLLMSDIARERGDVQGARAPLTDALKVLTAARAGADAEERARIERTLSRVLDRFGADKPAKSALERALQATPRDKQQTAQTAGQLVGRALVRSDLAGARDGLSRALAADITGDDLVYFALWVRLVERQLRAPSDGVPSRIFQTIPDDGRWLGRLAAFGAGRIKPEELVASAKSPTQKTEALFYSAMERRVSGDTKGADDGLKQVVAGPGLELMEMGFARDILSGKNAQLSGPLPADVQLPQ